MADKALAEVRSELANKLNGTGFRVTLVAAEQTVDEAFEYLDRLRESGATNMFGAGPYVARFLGLGSKGAEQKLAREILTGWMETFSERSGR